MSTIKDLMVGKDTAPESKYLQIIWSRNLIFLELHRLCRIWIRRMRMEYKKRLLKKKEFKVKAGTKRARLTRKMTIGLSCPILRLSTKTNHHF